MNRNQENDQEMSGNSRVADSIEMENQAKNQKEPIQTVDINNNLNIALENSQEENPDIEYQEFDLKGIISQ